MALAVMIGNVDVHGIEKFFAGSTPHVARRSASRRWDPVVDGGADDAYIDFVRVLYRCEREARKSSLTIARASARFSSEGSGDADAASVACYRGRAGR